MQKYIDQLLADMTYATGNVSWPYVEKELHLYDPLASGWVPDEEEDKTVPVRELEEWTGIKQEMLPPETMLNDEQLGQLLEALKKMLDAHNWSFVTQIQVPERVQYETIRTNFDQPAKIKRWHPGFFELCRPGTEHKKCVMGEYCHCSFFTDFFKDMIDEELTPEEEREKALEIELQHIKRKYGDDPTDTARMKYYPYHPDKNYDEENGNPYDYGSGDDEDEDGNWWCK